MSTPKSTATTQPETANMETPEEDASTSTPDTMSKINTAPEAAISILFNRIMTKFAEFLMPTFLRREYRNIIDTLAKSTYAFLALVLVIVFAIAEYQQPGYIPRPDKWTYGLVRIFPFAICHQIP
jgi:H+/gluconate symporter-like permease